MNNERFLQRINFNGDFDVLLASIGQEYKIGGIKSSDVIPIGYEDLNLRLDTEKSRYFAKLFASFRSPEDCQRYITIIEKALGVGVNHPKMFESSTGHLGKVNVGESSVRLALMEFVDGHTYYELGTKPNEDEAINIIKQAASINVIDYKPPVIYDSWAISNFLSEFDKKYDVLEVDDRKKIEPLVEQFRALEIDNLPHALVHGDIISTNVIKANNGDLYIIDFSVSNWYPRIQELAVLLCDLFFDPTSPESFRDKYNWAVREYQKHISLTPAEMEAIPLFAKVAHAMHIIGASYERSKGNTEGENNSWLELGRKGLELSNVQISLTE